MTIAGGGRGLAPPSALTVSSRKPAGEFGLVVLEILNTVKRKPVNLLVIHEQHYATKHNHASDSLRFYVFFF